jgi:hypothetical protein
MIIAIGLCSAASAVRQTFATTTTMVNVVTETTTGAPEPAESAAISTPPSPTVATDASSSTSEAVTQAASSQTTATQRESPVDPRVVSLRAMFPDYDDAILYADANILKRLADSE